VALAGKRRTWLRVCARSLADIPRSERSESRKLYGRKKGRPLGQERTEALRALLPSLTIPQDVLGEDHTLDPATLFDRPYSDYWLEIGFGQGEHVAALMRENPDIGYMGAEPFINGVAGLVKEVGALKEAYGQTNVRILHDDGMKLACSLAPESLGGVYVLNPDPWPKRRHNERRIINKTNLDALARIIRPGGALILSTDVPDLADWMVTHTVNHPAFEWQAREAKDFWSRPAGWHPTRYELKGANHSKRMCYLIFERR
jgi:tRNA (guanine-N7-)-methyltransferase